MNETRHRGLDTAEKYAGIPVHASAGVHEAVAKLLQQRIPSGGCVADLGAGHGALSQRLHDCGYSVVSVDLDCTEWQPGGLECHQCDLNGSLAEIAERGPFDAICVLDVVDHLENPRRFVSELLSLRRAEGAWLILSMPNPLDTFSCIAMFTRGIFAWAGPQQYYGGGHISVLPHWLLAAHLAHHGVRDQTWMFVAPYRHPSRLKRIAYAVISGLRKLMARSADTSFFEGQTAVVVARL